MRNEVVTLVFAKTCILPPTKCDLKFALYIVNLRKKIFLFVKKHFFFCINIHHLVRGFQKGITLGVLMAPNHLWPHPQPKPHPPPTQLQKYKSRPQMLYLFGILSPNPINFCRKKIFFSQLGRFFF